MKSKVSLTLIILALASLIYTGCTTGPCIKGNDIVIVENRNVGYFSSISSEGSFDVYIIQDTIEEVTIEAESNLMPYIDTRVKSSTLVIRYRDNTCIKNHYPIRITVRCRDIEGITLTGSGIIIGNTEIISNSLFVDLSGSGNIDLLVTSDNVETYISGSGRISMDAVCTNFKSRISGSGRMDLLGEADISDLGISGSGDIRAFGLIVNECYANISGSGSMYVFVNDLLDVNISGSGSVYYKGAPNVTATITGSGSVIPEP